ncbi:MAG TPA: heme exporter protein CcmD [Variovorax sp.]|nr:heme exporter protein CcmD [Variovorax sp.]
MSLLSSVFAGGHASYVAAAFGCAFVWIAAELVLLRRRVRRTPGPQP